MVEVSEAGGVDGPNGLGFMLPTPPEGLTWRQVEDPFDLKVGQLVLACRSVNNPQHPSVQPKDEFSARSPNQQTEYGRVVAEAVLHPDAPNGQPYVHITPRNDGAVRGTRVLPTAPNGYVFFRLHRLLTAAEAPGIKTPD